MTVRGGRPGIGLGRLNLGASLELGSYGVAVQDLGGQADVGEMQCLRYRDLRL